MSINNVILKPNYPELLGSPTIPFETSTDGLEKLVFYSKSARQSLNIKGKVNISANDGYIYLTNKRFVYITNHQGDIESFLIDLMMALPLHLSHQIKAPWFGANYWEFMFYSTQNPKFASDGFPKNEHFTGTVSFSDGGLFEFVDKLNHSLNDAVNNSHIDSELPRYE